MKTKMAVERQRAAVSTRWADRNRLTGIVIGSFSVRHDDIQAVDGTTQ